MSDAPKQPYGLIGLLWRLSVCAILVFGVCGAVGYVGARELIEAPESTAPDLVTMETSAALAKASKNGLAVLLEKSEVTDLLEAGHILAQRPMPGTTVKLGSTIRVTVSEKPSALASAN